jgi:hypothetical protein
MYKESKWAKEILSLQHKNGAWGYFHTLAKPDKNPITTEQALRRLSILGYTIEDEPIQRAVEYLNDCLLGEKQIPDRVEKLHNWEISTSLMFSTWIRRFTKQNNEANKVANTWAKVITAAFKTGEYNHSDYTAAYKSSFGIKAKGGRLIDFANFYPVSLVADCLAVETESKVFDYILNRETGIYYIYGNPLITPPAEFNSREASRYIGAIELLSAYKNNLCKLQFVTDWLMNNRNENGKWDMGSKVNDKIYVPLSDSWRRSEIREADCTYRISKLLDSINCAK